MTEAKELSGPAMHAENCQCDYCRAYVNVLWVELTLRVLCEKCGKFVLHTDRIREGVHWSPAVYCPTCGFIGIHEVIVGKIGVTQAAVRGIDSA